jgi:hypothetical protein
MTENHKVIGGLGSGRNSEPERVQQLLAKYPGVHVLPSTNQVSIYLRYDLVSKMFCFSNE